MKAKLVTTAVIASALALATTLVKPWEGYRSEPYRDIVGVLTVCYGKTANVEQRTYTRAECEGFLQEELKKHLDGVAQCIDRPLTENEWAAVLSWSYNVGVNAACRSGLVRKINAGAPASVWCGELRRWVYADGKYSRGLANRREAELAMCLGQR